MLDLKSFQVKPCRVLLATAVTLVCGCDVVEPLSTPAAATSLLIVSGDGLQGKAGEVLPAEFIIRAVDEVGDGVGSVPITWRVVSGSGRFRRGNRIVDESLGSTSSRGIEQIQFEPLALGQITVEAHVSTRPELSVTFTTEAVSTVIGIWLWMVGPGGSSDVEVPVGSPVEWYNWLDAAQVVSTSVPSGGSPFRSERLKRGERFEFVPDAVGTWEFVDEISGNRGTLTAR